MTTADEADQRKRVERARETGLFRYSLVQELLEPGLSQAERGWRARELAACPRGAGRAAGDGVYSTLTRWRRLYESGGFDALVPSPRQPAMDAAGVLALAEALKREKPGGPRRRSGGSCSRPPGGRRRTGPCSGLAARAGQARPGGGGPAGLRPVRVREAE